MIVHCRSILNTFIVLAAVILLPAAAENVRAAGTASEIIAFGDSITQGYPEVGQPPHGLRIGGYEPDLENLTDARYEHFDVFNYGWGGETSWEGLQRFDYVMSQHPMAKYVLLLEGTNDIWSGISREDTIYFLSIMVDKARDYGIEPVWGTLTPDLRSGAGDAKNVPLYNTLIRAKAAEKNVILADLYNEMVTDWVEVYTDYDLLHPNRAGYIKMAEVWFAAAFACSNGYLDQCAAKEECAAAGGFWFGDFCHSLPPPLNGAYLLLGK